MSRRIFSKFVFLTKRGAKNHKMSNEDFCDKLFEFSMAQFNKNHDMQELLLAARVKAEKHALMGDVVHYFIEGEGMEDWLSKAAPTLNTSNFSFIKEQDHMRVFVIHFEGSKTRSRLYGYLSQEKTAIGSIVGVQSELNGNPGLAFICSSDGYNKANQKKELKHELDLISGFLAYISCFPDAVHEGCPEGIANPSHFKGIKSFHVKPQLESEHGSVTPHFRSGHFRLLSSERFTKKRFQVIFIHECFVKGEAKTVEGIT